MMEINNEQSESRLNYLLRKYGRVSIILAVLLMAILGFTGLTPNISIGAVSFDSNSNKNAAIQGSKHVNPPVKSEYWTSSKFNF